MGILVAEAILPSSNLAVSNVYMSFSSEAITVTKDVYSSNYTLSTNYRVFSNQTKEPGTNIREPLITPYSDIEKGPFVILYDALRQIYPSATDC
jgi:hypothetical protein